MCIVSNQNKRASEEMAGHGSEALEKWEFENCLTGQILTISSID